MFLCEWNSSIAIGRDRVGANRTALAHLNECATIM